MVLLVPAAKDRRDVALTPSPPREYIHVPRPPLSAFVEVLWAYDAYGGSHARERVFPSATAELVVTLRDDRETPVLCGAFSESFVIDTADRPALVGVHFKPGGAFPFLPMPGGELHNVMLPLDVLWRSRASELRDRLLEARSPAGRFRIVEQMLLEQLVRPLARHRAVAFALSELVAAPHAATIASLVHRTGLSSRRFIELFTNEVGMSPKRFCRVRRFQRALTLLDTDMGDPRRVPQAPPRFGRGVDPRPPRVAGLVETALACGYYDQAHFIREFRAFAGVTPTTYVRARVAHRGHLPLD